MKLLSRVIATSLMAAALISQAALAGTMGGEIGLQINGYDKDQGQIYRLQEFNSLPRDGSVSKFGYWYHCSKTMNKIQLDLTNIGEDDVTGDLYVNYKDYASLEIGYAKTPHLLDMTNLYYTERVAESYQLNIMPLSKIHGSIGWSVEDKTGRQSDVLYVGQKTERTTLELVGEAGMASVLLGLQQEELNERYRAHGSDKISAAVSLAPSANTFASLAYSNKDYDLNMTNVSPSLEYQDTDLSTLFTLSKNIYLSSVFSNRERSNSLSTATAGGISYEDNYFSSSLGYVSKPGKLALTYKYNDRDYVGSAGIRNQTTSSLNLKGSSSYSFLGFKVDYTHGYKDMSGVLNSNLINFEELNGEFANRELSVNLLGFKKFHLNFTSKRSYKQQTPYATYGSTETISTNGGLSAYYMPDEALILFLNYYEMQNRMQGRQYFWRNVGNALTNFDSILQIYDETEYFHFGGVYTCTERTDLLLDYFNSDSNLVDPHASNSVRESELSLRVEHEITKTHSVNGGVTLSSYRDAMDSTISDGNVLLQIEVVRKF